MMGYFKIFDAENGTRHETDSLLCGHCQSHVDVKPHQDPADAGGFCDGCARVICKRCAFLAYRSGLCQPFEVELETYELQQETLRRWGFDPTATPPQVLFVPEF